LKSDLNAQLSTPESRFQEFFDMSPAENRRYEVHPPMPLDLKIEKQIDYLLERAELVDCNAAYVRNSKRNS